MHDARLPRANPETTPSRSESTPLDDSPFLGLALMDGDDDVVGCSRSRALPACDGWRVAGTASYRKLQLFTCGLPTQLQTRCANLPTSPSSRTRRSRRASLVGSSWR